MQNFKAIIDEDINRCEEILKNGDKNSLFCFHRELKSKYKKIIDGFSEELYSLFYDDSGDTAKMNIKIMKKKLELFRAMGYENHYAEKAGTVVVSNTNTNTFSADMKIEVSFSDARGTVENMSALKEAEIQEILAKIEELEKIVSSTERKSKKWEQAKDIIKWVADKGVDVGTALLPLILKIGQ